MKVSHNLPQLPTLLWCGAAHFQNHLPRNQTAELSCQDELPSSTPNSKGQSSQLPAGRPFPLRCHTFLVHCSTGKATKMHLLKGVERVSKLLFPGSVRSLMLLIRYTPTCEQLLLSNNTVRTRQTIAKFA